MSYDNEVEIRNKEIDGFNEWYWVKGDSGAWSVDHDWNVSHKHKYFEYLKKRDVIVTAGGNCGMYAKIYSREFKTVYAFEPDPLNFHCMVNNCQYDNVIKMQCALGSENKLVRVARKHWANVGEHTIAEDETCIIPMLTIDTLGLTDCDIIQLDVEGYEINVLRGAIETIKKFKPVITAENGKSPAITKLMDSLGYEYKGNSCSDAIYVYKD